MTASAVSVVVPTHGRRDRVLATVEPLLEDDAVREVIVVVDGSDDGTLDLLTRRAEHDPRLRPTWQAHGGPGAARQRGAQMAQAELVLFLDDDVVPGPGLALAHLAASRAHPGQVIVGRMTTPPAVASVDSVTTELYRRAYAATAEQYALDPAAVLEQLWMGNVSMPRTLALAVGIGDDELSALYFEDRDLGLRLAARGVKAQYLPDLVVRHEHHRSLASFRDDALRQGRALSVLHRRYPSTVPAPTARQLAGRAPAPARWLVCGAAGNAAFGRVAAELLVYVARMLGILRSRRAQWFVVVLLQRVGQAAGVASSIDDGCRTRTRDDLRDVAALLVPNPSADGPPIFDDVASAVISGSDTVVVLDRDRKRVLDRSGFHASRFTAHRWWSGATALANDAGHRELRAWRTARALSWHRRVRFRLAHRILRPRGLRAATIATRAGGPPAALAAAFGSRSRPELVIFGGGGPRRRAAIVVDRGPASLAVVKVGRGSERSQRAEREHDVLTRLHRAGVGESVPQALGWGCVADLVWTAETYVPGVPLADWLGARRRSPAHRSTTLLLAALNGWLADVGVATSAQIDWRTARDHVPLVGRWQSAHVLFDELEGVPAVVQHGDLASAFNVLVSHRSFTVIDWENAATNGLPLGDSIPLLCGALAANRGGSDSQAEYVVRLVDGGAQESEWFFEQVAIYCQRVGVPMRAAGALAGLAFARQASVQAVHRALVAVDGAEAPAWDSLWDHVAAEWMERPGLQTRWRAFAREFGRG